MPHHLLSSPFSGAIRRNSVKCKNSRLFFGLNWELLASALSFLVYSPLKCIYQNELILISITVNSSLDWTGNNWLQSFQYQLVWVYQTELRLACYHESLNCTEYSSPRNSSPPLKICSLLTTRNLKFLSPKKSKVQTRLHWRKTFTHPPQKSLSIQ